MALIDFILNVAALLLWLNWRSSRFDPLVRTSAASLVGTLKRAEPRPLRGWLSLASLVALLAVRAALYWTLGVPVEWTPKLDLGFVVLAFPLFPVGTSSTSSLIPLLSPAVYSVLSFARVFLVYYFWLLTLAAINRSTPDSDPVQKLIRLHLGRLGRWPWPAQLGLPLLLIVGLWFALHPLLVFLHVMNPTHSLIHVAEQGLLIAVGLLLSLKLLLPIVLLLHLITSYVYLGNSPLWDFIATTSRNLLTPLQRLPLRVAKLDLTPAVGVTLIFLLLHSLPHFVLYLLAKQRLPLWPQ